MHTVEQYSTMWVKLQQDDDYALINHHSLKEGVPHFLFFLTTLRVRFPFRGVQVAFTKYHKIAHFYKKKMYLNSWKLPACFFIMQRQ